jgi:hypothetical protein
VLTATILRRFTSRTESEIVDFEAVMGGAIPYEASGNIERSGSTRTEATRQDIIE